MESSNSYLFVDIAEALFKRCFDYQNTDGGLPETFPNTKSGCWTSAEIYAAIAVHGLDWLCPEGSVDSLENYLVAVCKRHGKRGLPYYEVKNQHDKAVSSCIVEPSSSFALGLLSDGLNHL